MTTLKFCMVITIFKGIKEKWKKKKKKLLASHCHVLSQKIKDIVTLSITWVEAGVWPMGGATCATQKVSEPPTHANNFFI